RSDRLAEADGDRVTPRESAPGRPGCVAAAYIDRDNRHCTAFNERADAGKKALQLAIRASRALGKPNEIRAALQHEPAGGEARNGGPIGIDRNDAGKPAEQS